MAQPPHLVIDDFLDPAVADHLLAQAIAAEDGFEPVGMKVGGSFVQVAEYRSSQHVPGAIDAALAPVGDAVGRSVPDLCAAVGMKPFEVSRLELGLTAHGDGDFYKAHIDARTDKPSERVTDLRLLSCVYYLHRRPAGFSGGLLALHGFNGAAPVMIEPVHNRLAVFPAFVPHEVLPVRCPSDDFADRRFSVNCWLRWKREN